MPKMVVGDVTETAGTEHHVTEELVHNIVNGQVGVVGLLVLLAVGMELDKKPGEQSDMQEMVVGDVTEVIGKEYHVLLEDLVQV